MANRINKNELINTVAQKTELKKKEVELVIETMLEAITLALQKDDKVNFAGFGTFRLSKRASREGINPQTKERIEIPAMNIPKFTAGKALKEAVK